MRIGLLAMRAQLVEQRRRNSQRHTYRLLLLYCLISPELLSQVLISGVR
jgi:hypothetical protein